MTRIDAIGLILLCAAAFFGSCGLTLHESCRFRCQYGELDVANWDPFDGCVCRDPLRKYLMYPPNDLTPAPVMRAGESYGASQ